MYVDNGEPLQTHDLVHRGKVETIIEMASKYKGNLVGREGVPLPMRLLASNDNGHYRLPDTTIEGEVPSESPSQPGMPFDMPGGPSREEHSNRNQYNRCPETEPPGTIVIEPDRKGYYDDGPFGGKWRWSDGSECCYGQDGKFKPGGGTFNFEPKPVSPGHIWKDWGAHYWYGGKDGYAKPDPTETY